MLQLCKQNYIVLAYYNPNMHFILLPSLVLFCFLLSACNTESTNGSDLNTLDSKIDSSVTPLDVLLTNLSDSARILAIQHKVTTINTDSSLSTLIGVDSSTQQQLKIIESYKNQQLQKVSVLVFPRFHRNYYFFENELIYADGNCSASHPMGSCGHRSEAYTAYFWKNKLLKNSKDNKNTYGSNPGCACFLFSYKIDDESKVLKTAKKYRTMLFEALD